MTGNFSEGQKPVHPDLPASHDHSFKAAVPQVVDSQKSAPHYWGNQRPRPGKKRCDSQQAELGFAFPLCPLFLWPTCPPFPPPKTRSPTRISTRSMTPITTPQKSTNSRGWRACGSVPECILGQPMRGAFTTASSKCSTTPSTNTLRGTARGST